MWSLGIIIYEMIFWRYPFPKKNDKYNIDRDLATSYFHKKGYEISYDAIQGAPHDIIKLIKLMLAPNPVDRPTWTQLRNYLMKEFKVQEHEFMNIVDVTEQFLPVSGVYMKVVRCIGRQVRSSGQLFWKSNSAFLLELRETLVYYCYIVCEQFNNIF